MTSFGKSGAGQALRALTIVAIGVGLAYVIQFMEFVDVMYNILYERNTATVSAKNASGDEAIATTNLWDAPDDPLKTVIRLKRAHGWFSTELFAVTSYGLQVGLHWSDDHTLDIQLDFDCGAQHTTPVERAGPIRIRYRFGDHAKLPAQGYTVVPARAVPQEPCP